MTAKSGSGAIESMVLVRIALLLLSNIKTHVQHPDFFTCHNKAYDSLDFVPRILKQQ